MPAVDRTLAPGAVAVPGFLDSSVGKKVVMAVTGIVLFGFVTVHMLGNLTAYYDGLPTGTVDGMNRYLEKVLFIFSSFEV